MPTPAQALALALCRERVLAPVVLVPGRALAQGRVTVQGFALRVAGGFRVGGDQVPILHPGARAHVGGTVVGEHFEGSHFGGGTELLQG